MKRFGVLLIAVLIFTGCATGKYAQRTVLELNYFGIAAKDINSAFTSIKNVRIENGHYKYDKMSGNDKIFAVGTIFPDVIAQLTNFKASNELRLDITNNSNSPLDMNYFTDQYYGFYKIDNEIKTYKLALLTEIQNYPNVINPNEEVSISLQLPYLKTFPYSIGITIDYGKVNIAAMAAYPQKK